MLLEDDERIYAFTRRFDDTELLVTANFSADTVDARTSTRRVGRGRGRDRQRDRGDDLSLGPWEARVYRRPPSAPRRG